MTATDRTFRAMARAEPHLLLALLGLLSPETVSDPTEIRPLDVLATGVDVPPPPADADWVGRLTSRRKILHVESQGYRDRGFLQRLVRYHTALALRFVRWKVETFALWIVRPPRRQRTNTVTWRGITVKVHSFVLREVPASRLLASPVTACFAPVGDPQGMTPAEVCERVVRTLAESNASWYQWAIAQTMANVAGWKDIMKETIQKLERPDIILVDFVEFGKVEGRKEGRREGRQEGRQEGLAPLVRQFERRLGRALTDKERERIDKRLKRLGADRLGDVVLDLSSEELATWLATPRAR
jgi:flagellar biosynthesis/type III secretory pathway protein FliH